MQNEIFRIVMGYQNETIVTFLNQGEGGTLMTIAKSLNQKKTKCNTHTSKHKEANKQI